MQTSGAVRREIAKLYQRHCERSEAIHSAACGDVDCFAALAMTWRGRSPHRYPTYAAYEDALAPRKLMQTEARSGGLPMSLTAM